MQINPSLSALQNLLNLVDVSNTGGPTSVTQVTAGAPSVATSETDTDVNTQVTLTAVAGQGFTGSVTIEYGRLSVADEAAAPTGNVPIPGYTTDASAILALVEAYYGFIPGEVSWVTPPTVPDSLPATTTAEIQASGSLVYLDGNATVNLGWASQNTQMLLHFDGGYADATGNSTPTVTGTPTNTATPAEFGSGAYSTNGESASYVSYPDSANLHLSDAWTIEGWVYSNSQSQDSQVIDKSGNNTDFTTRAWLEWNAGTFQVKVDGTSAAQAVGSAVWTSGAYQHFAVVQNNGTCTVYRNGVSVGSFANTASWGNNVGPLIIGNNSRNNGSQFQGFLDEIRFSGVARYTANFTPPTAPFTLD